MRAEPSFGKRLLAALARWDDAAVLHAWPEPAENGGSFGRRLLGALARRDSRSREFAVPLGMTGVVIAAGEPLPHVLPGGATYELGPDVTDVVLVPVRPLALEWRSSHAPEAYDAALEPIVIVVQGVRLRIEMSMILRIPALAAHALVRDFGDAPVQRFVEHVLARTVDAYFMEIAADGDLEKFLVEYQVVQESLETRIREAGAAWSIEAMAVTLSAADPEDPALAEALRQIAAAEVEGRALSIVNEEIQFIEAVYDRRRAQRRMEELVLRQRIEQVGADPLAAELLLRTLAEMQVPGYISDIGSDVSALLTSMPLRDAMTVVKRTLRETAAQRAREDTDPTGHL